MANPTIVEEILLEEYDRSRRFREALLEERDSLPRGSIRERRRGEHVYYYLQYREGNRVMSRYVPREDVEALKAMIGRREECKAAIKDEEKTMRQIERALGKEFINEQAGR